MVTLKVGQKVKFHTPFPDEDPNQHFIVLEVKEGALDTRVDITPVNFPMEFPPVYTVKLAALIVVE